MTLTQLRTLKKEGKKITCLTAYDASFAYILDQAGIDMILVGDSLGMVIQGHDSTLPVTIEDMIYHCQQVHRCAQNSWLVVDMPFMSYATPSTALENAARLMREGQAQMVKLEGGAWLVETVRLLTERGIPVCAHLGLTPQSVHQLGGYRIQGRIESEVTQLRDDAIALQAAGASILILECIPGLIASDITADLEIPTIGIGAGSECDGQVLVLYDMLGITRGRKPSFSKDFLQETGTISAAITAFIDAVKKGYFPGKEHTFN